MQRKACTETPESMHSMTVQYALSHRYLQIVKVGTTQFYSNEQKRLINGKRYLPFTVYTVIFVLDVLVSFVLP